jgi:hypothetical protein
LSELSLYHIVKWGTDGHSHSFLSMKEFCEVFVEVDAKQKDQGFSIFKRDWDREHPAYALFEIEIDEADERIDDYRVVFWFDN